MTCYVPKVFKFQINSHLFQVYVELCSAFALRLDCIVNSLRMFVDDARLPWNQGEIVTVKESQ